VGIEGIGPVSQYLRDNLRVSEFSVRIRPLARRSYEPQYQYGRLAPAYATARQRRR
jgi:alpha-D-ribose 1-methylphosphonate 5-triphosphate synthase subunit PhnL